eukprot:637114-Ditylum_brightwellii.AAC.1
MSNTWLTSTGNKLGRLADGIPGHVEGSNTIGFIKESVIPKGKKLYNIDKLVNSNGYVYCKIRKGISGLKQAAILAYKQLVMCLEKHSYSPIKESNGLWKHDTMPTNFALCVDDLGSNITVKQMQST